ncbi:uncharacterized protein LOC126748284 [Anthonomus grandis grandis]|uniref:uncharacterized protein LOC126748284 n=1 Tax=Anthonomus grandis grandis TaxID=2921223 RepID=UPI0021650F3E|nr:uncharacterized protein LOC126748284 [Anthonomus grandis grandis]XP_050313361.1 uncharacterized protein LOC126748284 [Anthonomus grandis grandis]
MFNRTESIMWKIAVCLTFIVKSAFPSEINHKGLNKTDEPIATVGSSSAPVAILSTTRKPLLSNFRLPCSCFEGQCGCCTGYILDRFNQKACVNMTYEPEEFAVRAVMSLNGVPFLEREISGKNPPPICIRPPRFRFIKVCMEFSNVYFTDRNMHLCMDAEANWEDFTLLEWSFDCVRLGMSGVQVVGAEDGGGIPEKPINAIDQTDEDYDDSARNIPSSSKNIIFHRSLYKLKGRAAREGEVSVTRDRRGNYVLYVP